MSDKQPLYEINIYYGNREFATICLYWPQIESLLADWKNGVSSITNYYGWHRGWLNRSEVEYVAYLWLIPKTITSITAEELPELRQVTDDEQAN